MVCAEIQYGWIPIATQRISVNGIETGRDGVVVYSLKNNTAIRNITDFAGKKVGVGVLLAPVSYHLGYMLMNEHGVHLFSHTQQVNFYGIDYERQFQHLMSGVIDVATAPSTWMARNKAAFMGSGGPLLIHTPTANSFESESFPFVTSAGLVPQTGVCAAPSVSWQLKRQVAQALRNLNGSSPAAKSAGVMTFTVPATNGLVRSLQELVGTIYPAEGGPRCVDQWLPSDRWSSIVCPSGYILLPVNQSLDKCAAEGQVCPSGLVCFCRPCIPNPETNYFNWQLVLGLCVGLTGAGLALSLIYSASCDCGDLLGGAVLFRGLHMAAARARPLGNGLRRNPD